MTRTSFRLKVALWIALVATGLSALSIRFGGSAQAGEPKVTQAEPKRSSQPTPNADSWNIEGVVVDEKGQPVGGATVRTMPVSEGPAKVEHKTAADGTFRFTLRFSARAASWDSWPKPTAAHAWAWIVHSTAGGPAEYGADSDRSQAEPAGDGAQSRMPRVRRSPARPSKRPKWRSGRMARPVRTAR